LPASIKAVQAAMRCCGDTALSSVLQISTFGLVCACAGEAAKAPNRQNTAGKAVARRMEIPRGRYGQRRQKRRRLLVAAGPQKVQPGDFPLSPFGERVRVRGK
jgi:hypothetical protein